MIYVHLDNVEQVYLMEAVERLHHDNVAALQNIYNANDVQSYSRDDVLGLMNKEEALYKKLKRKIEGSLP
jgi:hypothetical protein